MLRVGISGKLHCRVNTGGVAHRPRNANVCGRERGRVGRLGKLYERARQCRFLEDPELAPPLGIVITPSLEPLNKFGPFGSGDD